MRAWLTIAVLGLLGAAVARAAPPTGSDVEPLKVEVQLGTSTLVRLDTGISRLSVAKPSIAAVHKIADDTIEVRGTGIGRTMVVVWTGPRREILFVYVAAAPVGPQAQQQGPVQWRDNNGVFGMYRGSVSGSGVTPGRLGYTGQDHSLTLYAPTLAGTSSATADVDAPKTGPTRLNYLAIRYDDPLLSLELGDLSTYTLTTLGDVPQIRGGLAGYHDGKYELLLFGGVLRTPSDRFYDVSGPTQLGMQSQAFLAENLTLSLQGTRTQRVGADSWVVANPALHWSPLSALALDVEGGVSPAGSATRVRLGYEAPLLNINALYQLLGAGYSAPGSLRYDTGQVTVVLRPSTYYQVLALGGRASTGDALWAAHPPGTTEYGEAALSVFPWGVFASTTVDALYREERTHLSATAGGSQRSTQHAELGLQDAVGVGGFYRIAAIGDETRTDSTGTGGLQHSEQRAGGGRLSLVLVPFRRFLRLGTEATYQRVDDSGAQSNFYSLGQNAQATWTHVASTVAVFGTRQDRASGRAYGWSASASLALKPTPAHELRADMQCYSQAPTGPNNSVDTMFGPPRYYSGMLSYTQYFGSAVDAPGLFDFILGARVNVSIFVDVNEDGVRQPTEPGMSGIAVYLDDERLDTDSDGHARFGHMSPGTHEIRVDGSATQGVKYTTASRQRVTVGREDVELEVGVSDRAEVFGVIFNDINLDGESQRGEIGIGGVRIKLIDGTTIEQQTSETGAFVFKGLQAGVYYVEVDPRTLPPNFVLKSTSPGTNGNGHNGNGHNGNGHGGNGAPVEDAALQRAVRIELERGQVSIVRIPVVALRSVEGRIYLDRDRDGKFTDRDQPAAGVVVRAGRRQATTDAQGRYLFRELPGGPVVVAIDPVTIPAGRILASPGEVTLNLPAEPTSETLDFVLRAP